MKEYGSIGTVGVDQEPAIAGTFHTLIMQPTTFCNLDCTYCYLLHRDKRRVMAPAVASACAASIAEQGSPHPVGVVWHGGEPTAIPVKVFRELLQPFEPLRRAGQIRHEIQTNATLINRRWCDLFASIDMEIGVSIDGPGALNRNRLDRAGNDTAKRTLRGMAALADAGLSYSVICVVTPETIGHTDELADFFAGLPGCASVGFNIEEQEGAVRAPVSEEAAYRFWRRLVERRLTGSPLRVRDLDRLADYIAASRIGPIAHTPYEPIPTVSHAGDAVLLSPELLGVTDDRYGDFLVGNVLRTSIPAMIANAGGLRYVREFVSALNDCASGCPFYAFCKGAQAGNRYFEHGTLAVAETNYCRTSRQALVRATVDQLTHLEVENG
ncbi:cyclophane-forming radical SAM peptide maturase AmcB [Micromonospora vulcania]|uniref:Cyclophane-forming radical SAM peptide maturase AmcB n=1 Tax=Micromonospora vulcania TaxID=1441873 RepID=A0ABW1HBE7_9ACTN